MSEKELIQLNAYLDGALSPGEQAALEKRLQQDPALRAELDALRETVALLRMAERVPVPRSFTLDPAVYGQPARQGWWQQLIRTPVLAGAGVMAVLTLFFVVGLFVASNMGPGRGVQTVAMEAAPQAEAMDVQGEVYEEAPAPPAALEAPAEEPMMEAAAAEPAAQEPAAEEPVAEEGMAAMAPPPAEEPVAEAGMAADAAEPAAPLPTPAPEQARAAATEIAAARTEAEEPGVGEFAPEEAPEPAPQAATPDMWPIALAIAILLLMVGLAFIIRAARRR